MCVATFRTLGGHLKQIDWSAEFLLECQEFSVVTVKKEDRIEGALKANYKTKKYGFTGTFGSTGLVGGCLPR